MRRRIVNVSAICSVGVMIFLSLWWGASYVGGIGALAWDSRSGDVRCWLDGRDGRVVFVYNLLTDARTDPKLHITRSRPGLHWGQNRPDPDVSPKPTPPGLRQLRLPGFLLWINSTPDPHHALDRNCVVTVAFWWLLLPCFPAPAIWWLRLRRRDEYIRRKAFRLCQKCGYDLRATPDRCPECGTVVGRS